MKCQHCWSEYIPVSTRSRYCSDCFTQEDPWKRIFVRYRLTRSEWESMYFDQDGTCLICNQAQAVLVDHDHYTRKVRGLLCQPCNRGLGQFNDDLSRLNSALEYLKGY